MATKAIDSFFLFSPNFLSQILIAKVKKVAGYSGEKRKKMRKLTRGFDGRSFNGDHPLSDEFMFSIAPSIFAQEPHESRSDKYLFIPTIEVLSALRKEGFLPFMVAQSRTRIEGKENFTRHMVRLRKQDDIKKRDGALEIILCNSSDGTSSFLMNAGFFRFVCQNGMVAGETLQEYKIQHKGNLVDNIIDVACEIVDDSEIMMNSIDTMKSISLHRDEKEILARSALILKTDGKESSIEPNQLLLPKRWEDRKDDLWTTFNTIQENLIKGGIQGKSASGRKTRTRAVKAIDNNVKLNKALWTLADEMAKLKI